MAQATVAQVAEVTVDVPVMLAWLDETIEMLDNLIGGYEDRQVAKGVEDQDLEAGLLAWDDGVF